MGNPMLFAKEAALTKTLVCDAAVVVARIAVDIHGSYGLMTNYKVSRIYRDAIMRLRKARLTSPLLTTSYFYADVDRDIAAIFLNPERFCFYCIYSF